MESLIRSYFITFLQVAFFHIHFCYFFKVKVHILSALIVLTGTRFALFLSHDWKTLLLTFFIGYVYSRFVKIDLIKCVVFFVFYLSVATLYQVALFLFFAEVSWHTLINDNYLGFLSLAMIEFLILTIVFVVFPCQKEEKVGFSHGK